jgi:hypothetical protein
MQVKVSDVEKSGGYGPVQLNNNSASMPTELFKRGYKFDVFPVLNHPSYKLSDE